MECSETIDDLQQEIKHQYDEVLKDQLTLNDDSRQLVALSGLTLAVKMCLTSVKNAQEAFTLFTSMWKKWQDDLQTDVKSLQAGEPAFKGAWKGLF